MRMEQIPCHWFGEFQCGSLGRPTPRRRNQKPNRSPLSWPLFHETPVGDDSPTHLATASAPRRREPIAAGLQVAGFLCPIGAAGAVGVVDGEGEVCAKMLAGIQRRKLLAEVADVRPWD